jgi:hypothetical protein
MSISAVAVPAVLVAWKTIAGLAFAITVLAEFVVDVIGVGVSEPLGHVRFAALAVATRAASTSGTTNLALPARSLANVLARFACRFVWVDAFEPSFVTCRAYAAVDLPAFAALAENAPGCFMTSPRGLPKRVPDFAMLSPREPR